MPTPDVIESFITTNSIHQTFNRRVIEPFLEGRDRSPSGPANEKRMIAPEKSPKELFLDDPSAPHSLGPFGKRSLPLHLAYAIPDHPWIDSADGAAVRIAMTVAAPGKGDGILEKVTDERPMEHGENEVSLVKVVGVIAPNLQIGSSLTPPPPPNNSPPSSAERTRNAPNRSKGLSRPSRACASS